MSEFVPKKVKSVTVAEPASHDPLVERTHPMALVRWEDGESEILSEAELRRLIDRYRAVGQEIPTDLQNGLRQFEFYPLSQREQPTKPK
jgi:hypothetical protein